MNPLISVAPMMDCTDRHDRFFLRLISPTIQLYSEMITAQALHHGDVDYLLKFHVAEKPLVLQLGGSNPALLVKAVKLGQEFGYDEINLNVGCPSPRVSSGRFGACLMHEPTLVAECVLAMINAVRIPVTVKCRIGVDDRDSYADLQAFIQEIRAVGCDTFVIHARKAWLQGLSPKENREIPPLQYDVVYRIKKDFPDLTVVINGGIKTIAQIDEHLKEVDGVMIGRQAYSDPYFLTDIQNKYFSQHTFTRHQVIQQLIPYIDEELAGGTRLHQITRHLFGLFLGQPGAAKWRRYLSENACQKNAGTNVVIDALSFI